MGPHRDHQKLSVTLVSSPASPDRPQLAHLGVMDEFCSRIPKFHVLDDQCGHVGPVVT